ncbi:hypothetical protein M3644_26705 [Bacillus cereus]|uniref:hypothetical protein n=1 Tax=Bacillus cereus TaxID=1396 RepID=UPI0020409040|nr:hypothetical protein [Bacillus cereus]MCM3223345.1 hypothetical protein [Bacillus cereus]
MAEYKKKPVVVEAKKFTDTNKDRIYNWVTCSREAIFIDGKPALEIRTPKGNMIVTIGDYVIKEVNDEFYPCKAEMFEKIYEPADGIAKMVEKEMAQLARVRAYTKN